MPDEDFTPLLRVNTFPEENAQEQKNVAPTTRGDRAEEFPWRITKWPQADEGDQP